MSDENFIDSNNQTFQDASVVNQQEALLTLNRLIKQKNATLAEELAIKIINQNNNCLEAYYCLFQLYLFQTNYSKLKITAQKAIKAKPRDSKSHYALADAYRFLRNPMMATQAMENAVSLNPSNIQWQVKLGVMHKENGELEKALSCFNLCIEQDNFFSYAYWQRSDIHEKISETEVNNLQIILTPSDNIPATNLSSKIYSAFSLFKHFNALKAYNQAFEYLSLGATLQRQTLKYNHQKEIKEHIDIAQVFNQSFLNQPTDVNDQQKYETNLKHKADSPIFICGLPRSGTTLAEQIISSHPSVSAGDELFELAKATQHILQQVKPKTPFPYWANELTDLHWHNIGLEYLSLTAHINKTRYFTDKMPLNYKAIGLMTKALPQAKIIFCQRPVMDLLFGCYKQILGQGNAYSYDLDELSDMIIAQHKLMEHFTSLLPDKIFTLDYNELINNQQQTTKNLINFIGLEWHQQCLEFHNNPRTVHTVSNTQVRKPLFNSAIDSWKQYQHQLHPYVNKFRQAGIKI